MPAEFFVRSHHSGKTVKFSVVRDTDPLFDQDGWDGEMCIYRPETPLKNVDHLIIYHQY